MQKVIDYQLVYSTTDSGLVKYVLQQLSEGWQPIGGVSVMSNAQGAPSRFTQAMVLYCSDAKLK